MPQLLAGCCGHFRRRRTSPIDHHGECDGCTDMIWPYVLTVGMVFAYDSVSIDSLCRGDSRQLTV
jgi:hypothetical protein